MYKVWIQVFSTIDIILSVFRLGNATFQLMTRHLDLEEPSSHVRDFDGYQLIGSDQVDIGFRNPSEELDETKFLLLGILYYILQILTLSLAIFLLIAISEKNGLKQIRQIRLWTGGTSLVILIYIIYLIRRLYFMEDIMDKKDSQVWYFDIAEILIRFLFAVFVNKYVNFVNPGQESFDDIDPEIRQAFQKYVFQTDGEAGASGF